MAMITGSANQHPKRNTQPLALFLPLGNNVILISITRCKQGWTGKGKHSNYKFNLPIGLDWIIRNGQLYSSIFWKYISVLKIKFCYFIYERNAGEFNTFVEIANPVFYNTVFNSDVFYFLKNKIWQNTQWKYPIKTTASTDEL